MIYFNSWEIPGPNEEVFFRIMQNEPTGSATRLTQKLLVTLEGSWPLVTGSPVVRGADWADVTWAPGDGVEGRC